VSVDVAVGGAVRVGVSVMVSVEVCVAVGGGELDGVRVGVEVDYGDATLEAVAEGTAIDVVALATLE